MTNVFESESTRYLVVVNSEGQYSLWPEFVDVPAGWDVVFGPSGRQGCLDRIAATWVDMRPVSLVSAMDGPDA
ncbi:MbtH family protein [Streptomyces erythrochromogenes]|uniref:MbtH family protein n=1 Tax=Streptomyces erythrochromogenes TaxID=285574 RepID=UPI0033C14E74